MSAYPVTSHCDILYQSSPEGEGFQPSPRETLTKKCFIDTICNNIQYYLLLLYSNIPRYFTE
jgi:hypothetical protein